MSKHSARGSEWEAQRTRVLDRDGWTCVFCTKALVGSDATVDHVEPISLNPRKKYRDDELVAACRSCNGRKGDRPVVRMNYYSNDWL